MSRSIEERNGRIVQTIWDMDECKHLINEVCTNPDSDECCDYPHPELCARCPYFEEEDGIVGDSDSED